MIQTIEKKIKSQFFAEVEFGIPSKNCVNYGICRITIMSSKNLCRKCNHSTAIITVFSEEYVEFNFLKKSIPKTIYENYFSRKIFIVQETYESKEAEERINFRVLKGKYSIYEDASFFKIKFFDSSISLLRGNK